MAKLESRISTLEQQSQQAISSANRRISPCTPEEAKAIYDSFMNADYSESLVDMPTDPIECSRMYVQIIRGEIEIPLRKNHGNAK